MQSSVISVSEILNKAKTISTLGFSKGYNFDYDSASAYFDNLVASSVLPTPIFSGVLILEKNNDEYTVIDGFQRITTVNLLLCALCEAYKGTSDANETARIKIKKRFLLKNGDNDQPKFKLMQLDETVYNKILFSQDLTEEEKNSNLYQVYRAFLSKIEEQKLSGTQLFQILSKMQFMTIITDKTEIAPRDLYQALNENKGISQVNLITDFVFQQCEKLDSTSFSSWHRLIEYLSFPEGLSEAFFRDFLTTRMDDSLYNKFAIYNNFKNYYYKMSKYQNLATIIDNIYKYAQYYLKILNADFDNEAVKEQILILNNYDSSDTYPYLMEVIDDLENSHITVEAFLNILMMINSFLKNRQEVSVSDMSIDFSSLSKELNRMLVLSASEPEETEDSKLTINEINNLSNFEV